MAVTNPFDQKRGYQQAIKVGDLKPLRDGVIVRDMEFTGRQLNSGIILLGDDGKSEGIRPRWGRVYAVGPDQKDCKVGQWVFIEHGRWSRGIELVDPATGEAKTIRLVDNNNILLVSDEPVDEVMIGKLTGA